MNILKLRFLCISKQVHNIIGNRGFCELPETHWPNQQGDRPIMPYCVRRQ